MLAMVKSFETKGCTLSSGAVPCKFIHKHMLYCYDDDADNDDDDEDNMYTPLTSRVGMEPLTLKYLLYISTPFCDILS